MGNLGSIPGLGRSPGEGKSYSLQYSGLEYPLGSQIIVHGVTKSQTCLSDFHSFPLQWIFFILELQPACMIFSFIVLYEPPSWIWRQGSRGQNNGSRSIHIAIKLRHWRKRMGVKHWRRTTKQERSVGITVYMFVEGKSEYYSDISVSSK